jgi:hypothetical protein
MKIGLLAHKLQEEEEEEEAREQAVWQCLKLNIFLNKRNQAKKFMGLPSLNISSHRGLLSCKSIQTDLVNDSFSNQKASG